LLLHHLQVLAGLPQTTGRVAFQFVQSILVEVGARTLGLFANNPLLRHLNALLLQQLVDESTFFGGDNHWLDWAGKKR